jgi:hypothetical protein
MTALALCGERHKQRMLKSLKEQTGLKLCMIDGESGTTDDILFDDRNWALWFFIAKPFPNQPSRYVCISPGEIAKLSDSEIHTTLSLDEIEARAAVSNNDPGQEPVAEEPPLYPWPYVCESGIVSILPGGEFGPRNSERGHVQTAEESIPKKNIAMKGIHDVLGAEVRCEDGPAGTVVDFLFDDNQWLIRFAVVALQGQDGKKILVATNWIKLSGGKRAGLDLDFSLKQLPSQPRFCPEKQLNRTCEDIINTMMVPGNATF